MAKSKKIPDFQAEIPRFCLHCGKPIAPGENKKRKFCQEWRDQFGQIHDCKADYHTIKNQPVNQEFRKQNDKTKSDTQSIEEILQKHGNSVSTQVLDAYALVLCRPLEYSISNDGKLISVYQKHFIISDPSNGNHQIYIKSGKSNTDECAQTN